MYTYMYSLLKSPPDHFNNVAIFIVSRFSWYKSQGLLIRTYKIFSQDLTIDSWKGFRSMSQNKFHPSSSSESWLQIEVMNIISLKIHLLSIVSKSILF